MITILKDEYFRTALLNAIEGADREILFTTYKLDYQEKLSTRHLNAVVAALYRATRQLVRVNCILNMDSASSRIGIINNRAGQFLSAQGIRVKHGTPGRTFHAKLIIIDSSFAFVGSHNLTESSLCRNFEITLMIDDKEVVSRLREIYKREWGRL